MNSLLCRNMRFCMHLFVGIDLAGTKYFLLRCGSVTFPSPSHEVNRFFVSFP